jgi:hypothetical protein
VVIALLLILTTKALYNCMQETTPIPQPHKTTRHNTPLFNVKVGHHKERSNNSMHQKHLEYRKLSTERKNAKQKSKLTNLHKKQSIRVNTNI